MDREIIAIVPSAGMGKRFNAKTRKTFARLGDVPLLLHALKHLQNEPAIDEVIPVVRKEDIERTFSLAREHSLDKIRRIAPGGQERQDSIYNALTMILQDRSDRCASCSVLIHDGVRPHIPEGLIESLMQAGAGADGVIPAIPVKDTIKEVDGNNMVMATLDRERVRAVQTPQFFSFTALLNAYRQAFDDGYYGTDDASLIERTGGRVRVIEGSPFNIKVTTPEDLEMVQYLLHRECSSQ
jgi:2-C-methyl-D-erythritol 4-phosphate cytidylyltransferase